MLNDTIDEVINVAAVEGIDAYIHQGGELLVARNQAQLGRLERDPAFDVPRGGRGTH